MKALVPFLTFLSFLVPAPTSTAETQPRSIHVFIALCDNKTQGIAPVGEKIGNGDDADSNLYWGCDDGFGRHFRRSGRWKTIESGSDISETILRRLHMKHVDGDLEITAEAYRGSRLRECLRDFETAAASGKHDLVAFIGHNGLMDFDLPERESAPGNDTNVVILCCRSDAYFTERLTRLGCRPILTTSQLMYPGSFILHDALETWKAGGSVADIRAAAGRAYARNQKISVRAATGVFAKPRSAPASEPAPSSKP